MATDGQLRKNGTQTASFGNQGGGWVRLYQTKGAQLVPVTAWFRGYREIVLDEVKKAAKAEAKQ